METAKMIPVANLRPHPKNPRLVIRQDVVDSIAAGLAEGFHPCHALAVWPAEDGFLILSGHHRKEAAVKAGLAEVPCYVRDDLDEDQAYMLLATANSQGELSPLEIGMHALHYVDPSTGGRGKKGGLSEYAERVGRPQQIVHRNKQGAEVAEKLTSQGVGLTAYLDKAAHLAAIHKLPPAVWQSGAMRILKEGWSAKETAEQVTDALRATTDKRIQAILEGRTSHRELSRIDELKARVSGSLEYEETRQEWLEWNATEDPTDIKEPQAKRVEIETKESVRREAERTPDPEVEPNPLPNLVLADPPWRYDFAETDNRQIENQYPSATVDEIIEMRPETQPDSLLFLWATVAKMREAFEVLDGWGYEYKTHAVWDKEKIGMGYWFRGQHELLIVATKGKFSPPEQESRVSSVFREKRGAHSKKPECVYQWIEKAFPDAVKLEMFCRSPREGWQAWGNEA